MTCKVGSIPTDQWAAQDGLPASQASARLAALGHDVGTTTIKDHRGSRCSCARTVGARITAGTARILTVDIERLPGQARVTHRGLTIEGPFWDLSGWKHTIGYRINAADVIEWPRTICAAWRWYGDKRVHFAAEWDGRDAMLSTLWDAYDRADIVVGHNVAAFDTKKLRTEWALAGLPSPSPVKQVDTLQVARRQFSFESNTLDALCKRFGLSGKVDKYDAVVASAAVAGVRAAQTKLARYNRGDVEQTEALYDTMRGWIPNHPHVGTFGEATVCNQCGSDDLHVEATRYRAVVLDYQLYRCNNCQGMVRGAWVSARAAASRGVA